MFHRRLIRRAAVAGAILMRCAVPSTATQQSTRDATPEAAFIADYDTAMMNGMTSQPIGDVDRDFAAVMIAHQQGATDMTEAEFGYGKNEQLRRIAHAVHDAGSTCPSVYQPRGHLAAAARSIIAATSC